MSGTNQTYRGIPSPDIAGDPFFAEITDTSNPGNEKEVYSTTIASGKLLNLLRVDLHCPYEGEMRIYNNGSRIGSKRVNPANVNVYFNWRPFRQFSATDTLKIKYYAEGYRPSGDIKAYVQARELPV